MPEVMVPCGTQMVPFPLDERVEQVSQGASLGIPAQSDLAAAVRPTVETPLDRPPLRELARRAKRVTVAFDDPTVPCYAPLWEEALGQIVSALVAGGVAEEQITLLCANALHRQFTFEELARTIGRPLAERFRGRLLCHDAEDAANMVHLGTTSNGYEVELNRLAVETDLCVYLNTSVFRAFNGGWKSICVGLATYRSIRHHHSPDVMSMSTEKNRMHEILDEMGELVVARLGEDHVFKVETVLANPLQVGRMWGGSVRATRQAVLDLQREQTQSRRSLLAEKADIVAYGVPAWSPYAAYAGMNPLLTLVSTGLGYLGGVIEALGKPGCSVILATPCPDEWDEAHHPTYREVWNDILSSSRDPYAIRAAHEARYAQHAGYIAKYRHSFGFHPVHGIMATFPLKRLRHASRVFVAHAERPELVRHLGFVPTATLADALAQAREHHGPDARVALVRYPMAFNRQ
ncbi:MAG: DUF2088 domain-containing protein [Deltaproteobacteria bacterium]|nr:DUF2088 domain-containing protein [Deltaproteobacteria bacterium]